MWNMIMPDSLNSHGSMDSVEIFYRIATIIVFIIDIVIGHCPGFGRPSQLEFCEFVHYDKRIAL